jgi:hypothetical protein
LSSTAKELASKTQSLNSTVTVIENWKSSQEDHARTAAGTASAKVPSTSPAAFISSVSSGGDDDDAVAASGQQLQAIIDHMSSN